MIFIIEIDGSHGEGGGQMIRTAVALSALTGKAFRMSNIRKGRQSPGLRTQHLKSIITAGQLTDAKIEGAKIASKEVYFEPNALTEVNQLDMTIETAGSIGLALQMLSPVFLRIKKRFRLDIKGGAVFGKYAPPLQYIQSVLLPVLRLAGYDISIDITRYGFYPSGDARVIAIFNPPKLPLGPIKMDGIPTIEIIKGISVATKELRNAGVSERTRTGAVNFLKEHGLETDIKTVYCEAKNTGAGIILHAKAHPLVAIGSDGLGVPGLKAEFLGSYTARTILEYIETGCPVDPHISDQLLIYMALSKGKSSILTPEITSHARTNMDVISKFLDAEFVAEEVENGIILSCDGVGFNN